MKKKKVQSYIALLQKQRKQWPINPISRVQENKKKSIKKMRQENKKINQNIME